MASPNPDGPKSLYCEKCGTTMANDNFYMSHNKDKYPTGYLNQCKKCITMHLDNYDSSTFLWILQEIDIPWIPDVWNNLLQKYGREPEKLKPTSILGRYIAMLQLKPRNVYRWKDTEYLRDQQNQRITENMKLQGYDQQQIDQAVKRATFEVPKGEIAAPAIETSDLPFIDKNNDDYFARQSGAEEDAVSIDLTDEDRKYLRLKWGKAYKPEEWVQLEQLYNEMMESYDIQSAGHLDTLKKVCKTSLKADQLLDIGDVDGAQKMLKMYDLTMKSGNFTAAQNKKTTGDYIDSISELVSLCESEGFIPRYYVDEPKDKVDKVLKDNQVYVRHLVMEELNLGNMLERAIRDIEADREKEKQYEAEAATAEEIEDAEMFNELDEHDDDKISYGDYVEFQDQDEMEDDE